MEERFFKRYEVDPVTGCWNWTGTYSNHGYGVISGAIGGKRVVPKGRAIQAHRASWIIHHGEIPEGEGAHGRVVMHTCDNRACVNPKHLRLGSQGENVQDMIDKGRKVSGTPHGTEHWNAAIKDPEAIKLIRETVRDTKALAERFGVNVSTIKRIRRGDRYAG